MAGARQGNSRGGKKAKDLQLGLADGLAGSGEGNCYCCSLITALNFIISFLWLSGPLYLS